MRPRRRERRAEHLCSYECKKRVGLEQHTYFLDMLASTWVLVPCVARLASRCHSSKRRLQRNRTTL